MVETHTPWVRSEFDKASLWLACYCGWNAERNGEGTWNEHFLSAWRQSDVVEALHELEVMPAVVPDHGHGGIDPPYLPAVKVLAIVRAVLTDIQG
jgi:hypothetical protein